MRTFTFSAAFLLVGLVRGAKDLCGDVVIMESEGPGNWHALVELGPFDEDVTEWTVQVQFSQTVDFIECAMADVAGQGATWTLTSKSWDGEIPAGGSLKLRFIVDYSGQKPEVQTIDINGAEFCTDGGGQNCDGVLDVESESPGQWTGHLVLSPTETVTSWNVVFTFSSAVEWLESPMGEVTGAGTQWTLTSKSWDGDIAAGDSLSVRFIVDYSGQKPEVKTINFNGASLCTGGGCNSPVNCDGVLDVELESPGQWTGHLVLSPTETVTSWNVVFTFSSAVEWLESPMGEVTGAGTQWTLTSKSWDGDITAGDSLDVRFIVIYAGQKPGVDGILFNNQELCEGGCPNPVNN